METEEEGMVGGEEGSWDEGWRRVSRMRGREGKEEERGNCGRYVKQVKKCYLKKVLKLKRERKIRKT